MKTRQNRFTSKRFTLKHPDPSAGFIRLNVKRKRNTSVKTRVLLNFTKFFESYVTGGINPITFDAVNDDLLRYANIKNKKRLLYFCTFLYRNLRYVFVRNIVFYARLSTKRFVKEYFRFINFIGYIYSILYIYIYLEVFYTERVIKF